MFAQLSSRWIVATPARLHNINCLFCCSKSIVNIDFGLGPKTGTARTVIPLVGMAVNVPHVGPFDFYFRAKLWQVNG